MILVLFIVVIFWLCWYGHIQRPFRFLLGFARLLPAVAQTRPPDSDKGLMLAASANLITKSTLMLVVLCQITQQPEYPKLRVFLICDIKAGAVYFGYILS